LRCGYGENGLGNLRLLDWLEVTFWQQRVGLFIVLWLMALSSHCDLSNCIKTLCIPTINLTIKYHGIRSHMVGLKNSALFKSKVGLGLDTLFE
jgi:hypothetical protein